jgi:hypothetical protein
LDNPRTAKGRWYSVRGQSISIIGELRSISWEGKRVFHRRAEGISWEGKRVFHGRVNPLFHGRDSPVFMRETVRYFMGGIGFQG